MLKAHVPVFYAHCSVEMTVYGLCIVVVHMQFDNLVRLTCAAIDIVESSCTPRSRMLLDAMMLHPHTSIQRGGGCGMRLFGAANNMASVFASFKCKRRDASHALTSITQRRIRSTADAESHRWKSTYNCVSSAYT